MDCSNPPASAVLEVFRSADHQGSGTISKASLECMLGHLGTNECDVENLLAHLLANKPELFDGGGIVYEQWLAWIWDEAERVVPDVCRTMSRSKEESEILGVSVAFLQESFQSEVEAAFGSGTDPNYYEVNQRILFGPHGKGVGLTCPRDGQPDCSYVDAVDIRHDQQHTRQATVMLSWSWGYTVHTVVDSLVAWCETRALDAAQVFVWQCALCCNQYRVEAKKAQNEWLPFEAFKEIFEYRVRKIGHILALMMPWQSPGYVARAWCIFELHTATALEDSCKLDIIMPPSENIAFKAAITAEGLGPLWKTLAQIRVENAQASSQDDKFNIMHAVEYGPGYSSLNFGVRRKLQAWAAESAEAEAQNLLSASSSSDEVEDAGKACASVARLLKEIGLPDRAAKLVRAALDTLEIHKLRETLGAADLVQCLAETLLCTPSFASQKGMEGIGKLCQEAHLIHKRLGTLESTESLSNLHTWAKVLGQLGDLPSATKFLMSAYDFRKQHEMLHNSEGAALVQDIGMCLMQCHRPEKGIEFYEEAVTIRKTTGSLVSPDGSALLHNIAMAKSQLGDKTGALESGEAALEVLRQLGEETQHLAAVLSGLAGLRSDVGDLEGALQCCEECDRVRVALGGAKSANRMRNLLGMAALRKRLGDTVRAAQDEQLAMQIMMEAHVAAGSRH